MSGPELVALVAALAGLITGSIGAIRSLKVEKVTEYSAVVDAYTSIVDDLRKELNRLRGRVTSLEDENKGLRERIAHLESL